MAGAPAVEIVGLKSLMRDLAKASDPRAGVIIDGMKAAGRTAAEPVAAATRGAVPHDTGDLAGDVRVTASRTGAAVRMGRKGKMSYAGWIEFGGTRRRPHVSTRPFVASGRYLFPAAAGHAQQAATLYSAAIQRALEQFDWTNVTDNAGGVHD